MEKTEITIYTCKKCGHKWANRKGIKPRVCPKCKKYTWND